MNFGARKYGDKREWPYRRLQFKDPEKCQALQVVDIFIGALAYRLNEHHDKSRPDSGKRQLCDYILSRAKITDPLKPTPFHRRRLAVVHRDGTVRSKKR